jgi:hypothetical protein
MSPRALGRPIEEIIPNSQMRRVAETGEPILLDVMELGREQLVVTRMPIEDENKNVIGAIGFVLDHFDSLKPLIARMNQLESERRVAKRQLSQPRSARFTFDDFVGNTKAIAQAKELAHRAARQSFALRPDGLELTEVAPGVDIERNILALMDFKPLMRRDPIPMDARIFREGTMDLRENLLSIPLDQRFTYDDQQNLFFVNLEDFALRSHAEIDAIARTVENELGGLGRRVYAIVNYDSFSILPELLDDYSAMVSRLVDRFYSGVSRYTTSGFLRIKLGEALEKRGVAPHIFESAEQAQSDWRVVEGCRAHEPR